MVMTFPRDKIVQLSNHASYYKQEGQNISQHVVPIAKLTFTIGQGQI